MAHFDKQDAEERENRSKENSRNSTTKADSNWSKESSGGIFSQSLDGNFDSVSIIHLLCAGQSKDTAKTLQSHFFNIFYHSHHLRHLKYTMSNV